MLRTMLLRTPCIAALLLCCGAHTQVPPHAIDDGPLLCFTTNTLPADPCDVSLHVVPLRGDAQPIVFWRSRHDARTTANSRILMHRGNARVLARLDRDRLLLASYGDPYALLVVDLAAGTHRLLADGCPHEFVAVRDDHVVHLGDPREARDNFLYATPWAVPGERRRLAEPRFSKVLQVAGNLAIARAESDGALWVVSLANGTGRELCRPPASNDQLRVALSPGGQRLAIGSVTERGNPAVLSVVDFATGAAVRSWSYLPIQLSMDSSFTPCLEVGWHDDDEVVCSETRGDGNGLAGNFVYVRRSVATGEVTDETVYAPIGLHHNAPSRGPAAAASAPLFVYDRANGRLLRTDRAEPIATIAGERDWWDVTIAPDGQSAVARLGEKERRFTLFTAARNEGRVLADRFAYDAVWLPAAAKPRTGSR